METAELPPIDQTHLIDIVRRSLQAETAVVTAWEVSPLIMGMGGFGVYRVSGTARVETDIEPWALVLKATRRVAEHDDPRDWNYWKREALLYASGILDDLPAGLRAARCWMVEDRPPDAAWLWLEALSDPQVGRWPDARYAFVARRLGLFNGAFLTDRALPSGPWLEPTWVRSQLQASEPMVAALTRHGDHRVVGRIWPPATVQRILRLWDERDVFIEALDRLPQTFCHRDVFSRNVLFNPTAEGTDDVVAIDWAFAGRGAIGEDPASLLSGTMTCLEIAPDEVATLDHDIFAAYLDGLHTVGWTVDERLARVGYITALALRTGLGWVGSWFTFLTQNSEETLTAYWRETANRSFDEVLDSCARYVIYGLEQADEARELLNDLR